jgi:hypothetical protein
VRLERKACNRKAYIVDDGKDNAIYNNTIDPDNTTMVNFARSHGRRWKTSPRTVMIKSKLSLVIVRRRRIKALAIHKQVEPNGSTVISISYTVQLQPETATVETIAMISSEQSVEQDNIYPEELVAQDNESTRKRERRRAWPPKAGSTTIYNEQGGEGARRGPHRKSS